MVDLREVVVRRKIASYRPGKYSWVYRINSQGRISSRSEDLELGEDSCMSPYELSPYRGAVYNQLAERDRRVLEFELCYNPSLSPCSVS